jgi:hypothetical protein
MGGRLDICRSFIFNEDLHHSIPEDCFIFADGIRLAPNKLVNLRNKYMIQSCRWSADEATSLDEGIQNVTDCERLVLKSPTNTATIVENLAYLVHILMIFERRKNELNEKNCAVLCAGPATSFHKVLIDRVRRTSIRKAGFEESTHYV